MLKRLQYWINRRLTGSESEPHDLTHLPTPRTPDDQYLADQRFIVLDLETTGLNPAKDKVIAIGAVAIDGLEIPLEDQFDLILRRPELDITETVLVHGIGPEALTRGHETSDALLRLLHWMDGDPILAFHSIFDRKFLEKTLKQELNYTQTHAWLDVAELMPAFFPDALQGGMRLDNWADHFHLDISARHHAAADALATAELALIAFNKALKSDVRTLEGLYEKVRYYRRLKTLRRM